MLLDQGVGGQTDMHDTVLKAGTVVDGTGGPPFIADIAVKAGVIVEIGNIKAAAHRTIDLAGAIVAPGWVDIHTHYDGQATWDDEFEGSSANGVTTVVMGNCGVGFAPISSNGKDSLIELMEGVEDIPGSALAAGIPWGAWETFPEYLDFLGDRRWTVDVGTQLPHGALRYYVMGERAIENLDASDDDLAKMADLTEEAVRAGALGFSTSRIQRHLSLSGRPIPGTYAPELELRSIANAIARAGGAVFQAVPSHATDDAPGVPPEYSTMVDEIALFGKISRDTRLRCSLLTLQLNSEPNAWKDALRATTEENSKGALLSPQVAARSATMLTLLDGYHVFMRRPTYLRMAHLPTDQLAMQLKQPHVKEAILAETDSPGEHPGAMRNRMPQILAQKFAQTFPMRVPINYEPDPSESIQSQASRIGRDPFDVMYDLLLEDNGQGSAMVLLANYIDGNLEACRSMLADPHTVSGLGDAGAHVNFICDMSLPTFLLTHWVRDRTRGERLPIELVVAKQTGQTARLYGLADRGSIEVGKRADINMIDLSGLMIDRPVVQHDLPGGGSRILQRATGYIGTMLAGVLVREDDRDTGERPGRLIRNHQK